MQSLIYTKVLLGQALSSHLTGLLLRPHVLLPSLSSEHNVTDFGDLLDHPLDTLSVRGAVIRHDQRRHDQIK